MDDPEDAFHMLRTKDEAEAGERVRTLEKLNNERKGVVASMTKEVKKRMSKLGEVPQVIVMGNPDWRPSLVGLVANSLAEEYQRPVYLWGRDGKGVIKGSCRSDGSLSTLALMEATPDSFIEFGGHHSSGGFSVDEKHIHTLVDDLTDAYHAIHTKGAALVNEQLVDANLSLDDITDAFLKILASLRPFGEGNPKPLFQFQNVVPQKVESFGKTNNHTKLLFHTRKKPIEAIAFFKTPEEFAVTPQVDTPLSLIAHIEQTYFMGRFQTRLRIVDIV